MQIVSEFSSDDETGEVQLPPKTKKISSKSRFAQHMSGKRTFEKQVFKRDFLILAGVLVKL